jgi:hypothetical protein
MKYRNGLVVPGSALVATSTVACPHRTAALHARGRHSPSQSGSPLDPQRCLFSSRFAAPSSTNFRLTNLIRGRGLDTPQARRRRTTGVDGPRTDSTPAAGVEQFRFQKVGRIKGHTFAPDPVSRSSECHSEHPYSLLLSRALTARPVRSPVPRGKVRSSPMRFGLVNQLLDAIFSISLSQAMSVSKESQNPTND